MTVSAHPQAESAPERLALRRFVALALRYGVVVGFVGIILFFSLTTPTSLTLANIKSVLLNNVMQLLLLHFSEGNQVAIIVQVAQQLI